MSLLKGSIKVSISLNKSNCYYSKYGRCSLDIVDGFSLPASIRTQANDLLYCPRLYKALLTQADGKELGNPVTVFPCECNHGNIISGHQKACIVSKKNIEVPVEFIYNEKPKKACHVCSKQLTFYKEDDTSDLISIRVNIKSPD